MKLPFTQIKFTSALLLALTIANAALASTIRHDIVINASPPGAEIFIDGVSVGKGHFETNRIKFDKSLHVIVRVTDYASQEKEYSLAEVETATRGKDPWVTTFNLERIHLEVPIVIDSSPQGAFVYTNRQPAGQTPWNGSLVFNKKSGSWGDYDIRVVKPDYYQMWTRKITESEAETKEHGRLEFNPALIEIRRDIPVEFRADIADANVYFNDVPVGTTPFHTNVVFTRSDADQSWSTVTVRIAKDGYEYSPREMDVAVPAFVQTLTTGDYSGGLVSAKGFVGVKYVVVPLRKFELVDDKLRVLHTNALAELSEAEVNGDPPVPFGRMRPEDGFVLSRISAWPDQPDKIVYAQLTRDPRFGVGEGREQITGSHICLNDNGAESPLPGGKYFDIDPFVTDKYIYFSSDHDGTRAIWRMGTDGRLLQRITVFGNSVDTEPSVSLVNNKLAYTSRPVGAPAAEPSTIWVSDLDGKLAGPVQQGHSPAWSPNGETIAYVTPSHKIRLMDARGGSDRILTDWDANDEYPVWTHSGNSIVFASDFGKDDRKRSNWDIWIVPADGSKPPRQLTSNGSLDSCPCISSDGKYIYFFSNRGAQKPGQESLKIFRIVAPKD